MSLIAYLDGTDVLIAGTSEAPAYSEDVVDRVAAVCHEQWRYWAEFMLSHPEETLRFRQLLDTDFAALDEFDKDADRHWARLMLAAVHDDLDCRTGNRPASPG